MNDYAAMDPISQLGWGRRRGLVSGPGAELVADVFEAADMVHSEAMSQIGANSHSGDGGAGNMDASTGDNVSHFRERILNMGDSMESHDEGQ